MAKNPDRLSLFDRAMNLADRFFNGVEKFKERGAEAEKRNVEMLDELNPGFKEKYEQSIHSTQQLANKLEAKAEKILFGKDLYFGAGGEERRAADERRRSLEEQIKSAEKAKANQGSTQKQPSNEPER